VIGGSGTSITGTPGKYGSTARADFTYTFQHGVSNSVEADFADTISCAGVPNYTSMGKFWDEYRIDEVEMWVVPPALMATTAAGDPCLYATSVDTNDASVYTFAQLIGSNNTIVSTIDKPHYHRFVPGIPVSSGIFEGASQVANRPWISASSAGLALAYYGLKSAFGVSTSTPQFNYILRLHVSFRGARLIA